MAGARELWELERLQGLLRPEPRWKQRLRSKLWRGAVSRRVSGFDVGDPHDFEDDFLGDDADFLHDANFLMEESGEFHDDFDASAVHEGMMTDVKTVKRLDFLFDESFSSRQPKKRRLAEEYLWRMTSASSSSSSAARPTALAPQASSSSSTSAPGKAAGQLTSLTSLQPPFAQTGLAAEAAAATEAATQTAARALEAQTTAEIEASDKRVAELTAGQAPTVAEPYARSQAAVEAAPAVESPAVTGPELPVLLAATLASEEASEIALAASAVEATFDAAVEAASAVKLQAAVEAPVEAASPLAGAPAAALASEEALALVPIDAASGVRDSGSSPRRLRRSRSLRPPRFVRHAYEWFKDEAEAAGEPMGLYDLVQAWQNLTANERLKYSHMEQDDYDRFRRQVKEYAAGNDQELEPAIVENDLQEQNDSRRDSLQQTLRSADAVIRARSRALRRAAAPKSADDFPKNASSAYSIFCRDWRKRNAEEAEAEEEEAQTAEGEEQKRGRERNRQKEKQAWKELDADEREKYERAAMLDNSRLDQELDAWCERHPEGERTEKQRKRLGKLQQQRQKRRNSKDNSSRARALDSGTDAEGGRSRRRSRTPRPPGYPQPARTAYKFFCQEWAKQQAETKQAADESADIGDEPRFLTMRKRYCSLPEKERERLEQLSKDDEKRFIRDVESWRLNQPDDLLYSDPEPTKRRGRPKDYPPEPRTAYKFFCEEWCAKRRALNTPAVPEASPDERESKTRNSPDGSDLTNAIVAASPCADEEENQSGKKKNNAAVNLQEMRKSFKQLSPEDRGQYEAQAEEDRALFESKLQAWLAEHPEEAAAEAERAKEKRNSRPSKPPRPPGFPQDARTAYKFFCEEWCSKRRAATAEAEQAKEAILSLDGEDDDDAKASSKRSRSCIFQEMRKSYMELTEDERDRFIQKAREDAVRFDREFETWRAAQPNEGLGDAAEFAQQYSRRQAKTQAPPRPVARLFKRPTPVFEEGTMGQLISGLYNRTMKEELKRKKSRAQEHEQVQDGPAGSEGLEGGVDGKLPVAPANAEPEVSVDDLLGDLAAVDGEQSVEAGFDDARSISDLGDMASLNQMAEPSFGTFDAPVTAGAPRSYGPQLVLDAEGNVIIDESSLTQDLDEEVPTVTSTPIFESAKPFDGAYKRAAPANWSPKETEDFYEALSLYGTDLFLIHTFFRNKTPAQVKSKYKKEMKVNRWKVHEYAVKRKKTLTKEVFEKMHGRIDTSKHFKPPPTPQPREDTDPDGSLPNGSQQGEGAGEEEEEAEDFFQQPEYTEEDESATTARLMALFDM